MKVSVLMGGASAEREVSIKTGSAVIKACKELGYTATPIEFYDDYKSLLSNWNAKDVSISEIWNSEYYKTFRTKHLNGQRSEYEPCKRCISA